MKAVKTMQRYQCDFCKYRSTRAYVEQHEGRCFRNPNRFCDFCENKGFTTEHVADHYTQDVPCPYCSKFDPKMKAEIEEREKALRKIDDLHAEHGITEVPF